MVYQSIYEVKMKPPAGFKKISPNEVTNDTSITISPPTGFKKVDSVPRSESKEVAGLFNKNELATKVIPQFTKGLYEGFQPVSESITKALPKVGLSTPERTQQILDIQAGTPKPKGLLPWLARQVGELAPIAPFEQGAGLLFPKVGAIAKTALGVAGYTGTKSVLEGKSLDESAKNAALAGAGTYVGGKIIGKAGKFVAKKTPIAVKGVSQLVRRMTGNLSNEELSSFVKSSIEKALRPSTVGKNSAAQLGKYISNAEKAVNTIVKYKDNLNLKNEYGELTGKLPQTLEQFGEAIDQIKTHIFSKYNAMAERTGEAGIKINLAPIADDIEKQVNNKAVSTFFPELRTHAMEMASKLREDGIFTPQELQQAIEMFNSTLKAYYRNPNPQSASKVVLDVALTTKLRKALDDAISNLEGESYQALKNEYASLRTIQDDVMKRAVVDARKNLKGFFDLTDVLSTGDIVQGLTRLDPSMISRGGAMRMAKNVIKAINDPNRQVRDMFTSVSRHVEKNAPKYPDIMDAEFEILGKGKMLPSPETVSPLPVDRSPKLLTTTKGTPKLLGVTSEFGEGFERVSPQESFKRIKEFAFRYYNPKKQIVEIPEGTVLGTKAKSLLKKIGVDPFTGKMKYGKPSTAFQRAWERAKTLGTVTLGVGAMAESSEASTLSGKEATKNFEGFRSKPYKDPGSKDRNLSVGYGFNLSAHPEIKVEKGGMSRHQADKIFNEMYSKAEASAKKFSGKIWTSLNQEQKDALTDMSYQMRFIQFPKMRRALALGKFKRVAKEILNSSYGKKYAKRAKHNALAFSN